MLTLVKLFFSRVFCVVTINDDPKSQSLHVKNVCLENRLLSPVDKLFSLFSEKTSLLELVQVTIILDGLTSK